MSARTAPFLGGTAVRRVAVVRSDGGKLSESSRVQIKKNEQQGSVKIALEGKNYAVHRAPLGGRLAEAAILRPRRVHP